MMIGTSGVQQMLFLPFFRSWLTCEWWFFFVFAPDTKSPIQSKSKSLFVGMNESNHPSINPFWFFGTNACLALRIAKQSTYCKIVLELQHYLCWLEQVILLCSTVDTSASYLVLALGPTTLQNFRLTEALPVQEYVLVCRSKIKVKHHHPPWIWHTVFIYRC